MAINVLYINGGPMNRGGIESFMMNYVRNIDSTKVHIDFAVRGPEKGAYDDEIIALGCELYRLPMRSKHPIAYQKKLKEILQTGKYQIIHSHADAMSCWILRVAKECGIPVRIAHSHNTQHLTKNPLKFFVNEYARRHINQYTTHRFACSKEAGKWLFGEEDFMVIRNAIDSKQYVFDYEIRKQLRSDYKVDEDTILLGHVGRFDTQKNHAFLIEMFDILLKKKNNFKLMCIGDGWLKEEIEKEIEKKGIADKVIFVGQQEKTAKFYNAFDVFVFPSLFEGLSFVLIEAQANGITCLCSEGVPEETNLSKSNHMIYLPLEKQKWVDKLIALETPQRYNGCDVVIKQGYDIISEAKKLEKIYVSLAG